jgi:hypothetical protein
VLRRLAPALAGIAVALPLALWLRGFMVDDALISARYAHHLATGHGYRFNPGGPPTDGVTPLGWPLVLVPFAKGSVLAAFEAAKLLGLAAWLAAAALLATALASLRNDPEGNEDTPPPRTGEGREHGQDTPTPRRGEGREGGGPWLALALVAFSVPLAAWANAGMETGVVLALATVAVAGRALARERLAMAAAGFVVAWRPECLPWAAVLALSPPRERARAPRWPIRAALAVAPFFLVAALRLAFFGRPTPLALLAKPSDLLHGLAYAGACFLLTGPVALLAWRGLPGWVRGLQLATLAQYGSAAVAGGDWMPFSRLVVPALPGLVLAAGAIAARAPFWLAALRLGLATAGPVWVLSTMGPIAAAVGDKRLAVVDALAPVLAGAHTVAALDVGWVGAATPAPIVDLAGVTDPAVAVLEGGHTSKRVPHALFDAREVDTLVLLLRDGAVLEDPWTDSAFARWVELWVAHSAIAGQFVPVAQSSGALRYVVLRR